LKPIEGSFHTENSKKGHPLLTQILIDDNFFNSLTSVFSSSEFSLSVRKFMDYIPKLQGHVHKMSTSTLKPLLPDFVEDYGEDKRLDVKVSLSQSKFLEGFPDSKMSVFSVDKNGEWKGNLNLVLTILVDIEGHMKPARNLYVTLTATAKTQMDDQIPSEKKFTVIPKNIKLSQVKMMKEDEEMEME